MSPRKVERMKRRGQADLSLPYKEMRYEVGEPHHGERLDAFLAARVSWRSRTGIRELIEEGMVDVVAGKDPQQAPIGAMRVGLKLRWGQEVVLRTPAPQPEGEPPPVIDAGELEVVFEDAWLVAVNKPPHISVHPSKGHLTGSLVHLVHERHRAIFGETADMPTLCHRLDRETSGLVLLAKDQLSRSRVGKQFEARHVRKTYLARVAGLVQEDEGLIDLPLGRSLASEVRLKMGVRHDADGQPSRTAWRVLERREETDDSLVELKPHTGRQHQLRVHLAAIGHPILGDKLYLGGEEVFLRGIDDALTDADRALLRLDRQALHSWKLAVEHPMTGREVECVAPPWPDLEAVAAG